MCFRKKKERKKVVVHIKEEMTTRGRLVSKCENQISNSTNLLIS